jgi:hypothetical protein
VAGARPLDSGRLALPMAVPLVAASDTVEVEREGAADSAAAETARPPDRDGEAKATEPTSRWEQPKYVMLRSLIIPGWGQFHNHAYFKAVGVAVTEGYLAYRLVQDSRDLDQLKQQAIETDDDALAELLIEQHNALLASYQTRQWVFGLVVVYALLDAYIDAHFRHFRAEFGPDPALPKGQKSSSLRISVGGTF